MVFLWKCFANLSALAGVVCWYCAASTSDFWILEMGQDPPANVGTLLIWGAVLIAPKLLEIIVASIAGHFEDKEV